MSELTALEIALRLEDSMPICGRAAVIALRRQHAEIERLKADAERVNSCAKNLAIAMHGQHFSHVTQWEPLPDTIGLITQIDNMSCWPDAEIERLTIRNSALTAKANALVIENARLAEKIDCLTAERDAAAASAVLTERTAIAAQLREWADELGFTNSSWRWKTPGGLLYRAAEMVSDRTKP